MIRDLTVGQLIGIILIGGLILITPFVIFKTIKKVTKPKEITQNVGVNNKGFRIRLGSGDDGSMGEDDIEYALEQMLKKHNFLKLFKYSEIEKETDPKEPFLGYAITYEFNIIDPSKIAGNVDLAKELNILKKDILIALKDELKNTKELSKILDKLISSK